MNDEAKGLNEDIEKIIMEEASSTGNPSLSELVEGLVTNKGLKFRNVAKTVYALWKQGSLELLEPKPLSSLTRYTLSVQSLWFWATTALVTLTMPVVFYVVNPPLLYIRYILGSFFVLYLPGSMLIEALYPRGEDLESLERLALSMGISLAIVPLMGLLLNYTPWGIRLTPITTSLAAFAEAMAITALTRKYTYYKLSFVNPEWNKN